MLDIKFVRENKELVKENIRKKFQDHKLPLVDEAIELDVKIRALKQQAGDLRAERNSSSSKIGLLMREKKIEEANAIKARVVEINAQLVGIEEEEAKLSEELKKIMMTMRTGTIVQTAYFPRKVRAKRFAPLSLTPSLRIRPIPKSFFPIVWPFPMHMGTVNSMTR